MEIERHPETNDIFKKENFLVTKTSPKKLPVFRCIYV